MAGAGADCVCAGVVSGACTGTNGDAVGRRKLGSCGLLRQGVELPRVGASPRVVPVKFPLARLAGVPMGPTLASQWGDAVVSALGEKVTCREAVVLFSRKQCGNDFRARLRAALWARLWARDGLPWRSLVGTPLAHGLEGVVVLEWEDAVACP